MSWSIEKKDDKYRIYSNITKEYITDYISRNEFIRFLFWQKFEVLIEEMLKAYMTFPDGWYNKSLGKLFPYENDKEFEYFYDTLLYDKEKLYESFLMAMDDVGVFVDLKDIDGTNIHNIKDNNTLKRLLSDFAFKLNKAPKEFFDQYEKDAEFYLKNIGNNK